MSNEHSKKMSGWEAAKRDSFVYAEFDEDVSGYGVFGDNSGHCYASFSSKSEAEKHAEEMTRTFSKK